MTFTVIDPVHGMLIFPNFIRDICDTPEFQRLRNIRQLGNTHLVFPGASNTRFEHCLGVAYLVQKLLSTIEKNSGRYIDESLKKYVTIAGLLHDLGHGPFSHMWEKFVHTGSDKTWKHEETSCVMVERIFQRIPLADCSKEHIRGVLIIKSLILGDDTMLRKLLPKEDMFISEIVCNPFCEVDVDKWDYISRDAYHLKYVIDIPLDFCKFYEGAKISFDKDGVSHIAYNVEDVSHVLQLFETRSKLHREVYQCQRVALIEATMKEILVSAEANGFRVNGVKLSEVHRHPEIFILVDDAILRAIQLDSNPKLNFTKNLIIKLQERKLSQKIEEMIPEENLVNGHGKDENCGEIVQFIDLPRIPRNLPVYIKNMGEFFQPFLQERATVIKTLKYKTDLTESIVENTDH